MFKVNKKDSRTTLRPFSRVFIVDFEYVNVYWVVSLLLTFKF